MELRVWGVGNALLGDDAVGCRVAELLAGEGAVDCGSTPENHLAGLRRKPPKTLLIVDAADMGLEAGQCRLFSLERLEGAGTSNHGIPLPLLLAPFMGGMEIVALGIQPASLRLGVPLSEPVERAARDVADRIARNVWRGIPPL